ncbi:hypothetical protein [Dyadobacter sp. 676]|uniref:Uncharacterized protein n=1 Tax=Dyadobacter sp. 676 TaxID=3088362 RepID=A0AAU8FL54_9BACT
MKNETTPIVNSIAGKLNPLSHRAVRRRIGRFSLSSRLNPVPATSKADERIAGELPAFPVSGLRI